MKKAKAITSALLGVVMCTGLICALTANAVEAPAESPVTIAKTEDVVQQDAADTLAAIEKTAVIDIPSYPTGPHLSIEDAESELELQDTSKAVVNSLPTQSHTLPYTAYLNYLAAGDCSYTAHYFTTNTNKLVMALEINGTPNTISTIQVRLYRQNKYISGSSAWEYVDSHDVSFISYFKSTHSFTDLSDSYVYCLRFDNLSDNSQNQIDGTIDIDSKATKFGGYPAAFVTPESN